MKGSVRSSVTTVETPSKIKSSQRTQKPQTLRMRTVGLQQIPHLRAQRLRSDEQQKKQGPLNVQNPKLWVRGLHKTPFPWQTIQMKMRRWRQTSLNIDKSRQKERKKGKLTVKFMQINLHHSKAAIIVLR
jgi:hypothetical protein